MTLLVLVHTHVPVENYHELKLLSVLQELQELSA